MPYTFSEVLPPEKAEQFYKEWDDFSWTRENFYAYTEWASKRKEQVLLRWIQTCQPKQMLDLGCGSAILLKRSEKIVPRIVGLDINLELLQAVKEHKDARQITEASAYAMPFSEGSFDLLLCSEVLEHLAFPEKALGEMQRVLAGNGVLLVTTPHLHCYDGLEASTELVSRSIALINAIRRRWRKRTLYPYGYNTHLQKRTPSQWRKFFEHFFAVEVIEPIFIFPYIPTLFRSLKRAENWLLQRTFSWQERIEDRLKHIYPFCYLGQLQLYVLQKRR